jgi:hypothetical protein
MTHLTVHAFPVPDVERAWRAGLAQVEVPSHYNAPEFFLDPLYSGTNRFAVLALDGAEVVGILTGAHLGAEVVCGHQSRPQVCFSKPAEAAAEALAQGLIKEAGDSKLLTVYA